MANDRDLWLESEEIGVKARHSSFVFIDQSSLPFRMARPLDCRTEKSVNRIDHVPQYSVAGVVASSAPKLSPLWPSACWTSPRFALSSALRSIGSRSLLSPSLSLRLWGSTRCTYKFYLLSYRGFSVRSSLSCGFSIPTDVTSVCSSHTLLTDAFLLQWSGFSSVQACCRGLFICLINSSHCLT